MADCNCSDVNNCTCGCGDGGCWPPPSNAIPGSQGEKGDTGAAGTAGVNAFTLTIDPFTVPAVSANVNVAVNSRTSWLGIGQELFVESAGYYQVAAVIDAGNITLTNLGSPGNATPGTVIAMNSKISPAGPAGVLSSPLSISQGGTGQATQIAAFGALSPLTTTGDIIIYSSGANGRLALGSSGQVLTVSGSLPSWSTNAPAAANITGQVSISQGGTGASTASGARTNLDIVGIAEFNNLTGSNVYSLNSGNKQFTVTAGTGSFTITTTAGILTQFLLSNSATGNQINFTTGTILGPWTYTARKYTVANAATYTYIANAPDSVVSTYSSTGSQTIILPATATGKIDGTVVKVSDGAGNASTHNIILSRSDADTIVGATTYIINNNYGSVSLIYVASITSWVFLP